MRSRAPAIGVVLAAALGIAGLLLYAGTASVAPTTGCRNCKPAPKPAPVPPPKPCPPNRPCPRGDRSAVAGNVACGCCNRECTSKPGVDCGCHGEPCCCGDDCRCAVGASVGGRDPDLPVDLPGDLHQHNIGAPPPRGPGCCVFRSLDHAARWQNVPAFVGFPEWMVQKGIPGGGYPQKVDKLAAQIAADRALPTPAYIQIEGDVREAMIAAVAAGRMVCGTYSRSPSGRYEGRSIAHMVNYVRADAQEGPRAVAVLDNNHIGSDQYEYMSWAEWKATCGCNWIIVLLAPPAAPPPHNAR